MCKFRNTKIILSTLFGNKSRDTQKGRYSGGISLYYKQQLDKYVNITETHQFKWDNLGRSSSMYV